MIGRPGADGRHHGLFHQVHFAGLGAVSRFADGALFHLRDLARNADDDARMHQHLAAVRLLDEVIQHPLGDFEIGDDAVFHGPDGDDVAGRSPDHFLGFFADCLDFAVVLVDGDDGGLIHHDAFPFGEHQRVCGAQIDGEIGGDQAENGPEIHGWQTVYNREDTLRGNKGILLIHQTRREWLARPTGWPELLSDFLRPKKGTGYAGYALVATSGDNSLAVVDLTAFRLLKSDSSGFRSDRSGAGRTGGRTYVLTPSTGTRPCARRRT